MKTTGKPTNPLKTYYIIKGCLIAKSPYFRFQAAKPKQILISSRKKRHFKTWRESIIPKNSKIASNCVIKWRTNLGIDPIQSQQVFIIFLFICLLSKVTRLDSPSLPLVLVLCGVKTWNCSMIYLKFYNQPVKLETQTVLFTIGTQ